MSDPIEVSFPCEIIRVATNADDSIRVTLDMEESCIPQATLLMVAKRDKAYMWAELEQRSNG